MGSATLPRTREHFWAIVSVRGCPIWCRWRAVDTPKQSREHFRSLLVRGAPKPPSRRFYCDFGDLNRPVRALIYWMSNTLGGSPFRTFIPFAMAHVTRKWYMALVVAKKYVFDQRLSLGPRAMGLFVDVAWCYLSVTFAMGRLHSYTSRPPPHTNPFRIKKTRNQF